MKGQRTATVLVLVEAGSEYETKRENGISHFLEHMCFKGTERRPSAEIVASELDAMGAEYNAFTGHEYTGYYAKVSAKHLPAALDIVADIYAHPRLLNEDIEREKGVIIGEIDMRNDMLPSRAAEQFLELLYGDQPAGWPIAGAREHIPSFTREDFLAYRAKHYLASSTLVVVAGGFDAAKIRRDITRYFSAIPKARKTPKLPVDDREKEIRVLHKEKASDQTHLVVGARGIPSRHKDIPAITVLSTILGSGLSSRLFMRLRGEMGIGYYVHASHDAFTDHGVFSVSAGSDTTRVPEAVAAIRDEFDRIRMEDVPEAELKKAKEMLRGKLALGLESSDEVAEFYGFQEILRCELRTPEETMKRIFKVTAKDIRRVARALLDPKRLYLASIGPAADTRELERILLQPLP
jgi:predicted Zn-dependent peptidase